MISLELERGRIRLRSHRPLAGIQTKIPGSFMAKGRGSGAHWSIPLSLTVCQRLRDEFGAELEIGPRLWAWAKGENAAARSMKALAGARDADMVHVPRIASRLAKAMESRTYQRVGARFIADAKSNGAGCLVADQPGLGKTLEALGGVVESQTAGPYLVVTPKTSVTPVWAREIPRWLDDQTVVTLPEGDRQRNKVVTKQRARRDAVLDAVASSPDLANTWVIVHPEAVRTRVWWVCGVCGQETPRKAGKVVLQCGCDADLRKRNRVDHEYPQLFGRDWGAVIVDESDRSLLRLSGTPTQARQGMELLPVRADGLKIAMTGTPTRGRPHLLWGQLNWLDPKAFPSFWNWVELFWEVTSDGYSSHIIGALRDEERLWASLDRYVLRRTKAEVAPDLPAKTYVGTPAIPGDESSPIAVWLSMEGVQAKAYVDMLATSAADLPDGSRVEAIGILAELMRLKQFAGASGRMESKTIIQECKDENCLGPEEAEEAEENSLEAWTRIILESDPKPERKPHSHSKTVMQFHPALPSNKFEYLVQLLDELGFPDSPSTKVVVVSQFTEMLELFAKELPARLKALSVHSRSPLKPAMRPVLLTGAQSGKRREEAIEAMNRTLGSGAHLMLLQTKTGGVAITLDQVDVMVFLDETWVPDDQEQAEDRIHRVSRPRPVWYHYLKSLDTVDLGIALTNAERDDNSKRLLDGRRGVEYARAVLRRSQEMSGGMDASAGGYVARRSSSVSDGNPGGARETRAMGSHSGSDSRGAAPSRRNHSETDSSGTLAPKESLEYKGKAKGNPPKTQGDKKMAKQMTDEQILAYKGKESTVVQTRYADWLIEKLELEFPNAKSEAAFREAVRLATALRMIFQASPENQGEREEAKAAREEASGAKAEAKKAAKADKKAKKAKEAEEADDADDADDAPEETEAKPAKGKAAAKKAAPKAAPKAVPKDEEDDADTAAAAPAKGKAAAPKKASARSGAKAPF